MDRLQSTPQLLIEQSYNNVPTASIERVLGREGVELLPADGAALLSQHVLLNLAGCGLGQFSDEDISARHLEVREVRARKLTQLLGVRLLTAPKNHECVGFFAPFFVGDPDDRHLENRRVLKQHSFDFYRRYVLSAA